MLLYYCFTVVLYDDMCIGLRPGRTPLRLEIDNRDPNIIHCYGHGGSGVTIAWGCARDVTDLLTTIIEKSKL